MKFIKIKNLKNFIIQKNATFKEILKIFPDADLTDVRTEDE